MSPFAVADIPFRLKFAPLLCESVLLSTSTEIVFPVFVRALPASICPAPENCVNTMLSVPSVAVPVTEVKT